MRSILTQMPSPPMPELPPGPSLERVRAPLETSGTEPWQLALAIGATLLFLAFALWLTLRARKKAAPPSDPIETAMAEIDTASSIQTDDERFTLLCANAVRRALQARFDLPALSKTTDESTRILPLPVEQKATIHHFLSQCDRVKFAKQALNPVQRREMITAARSILEKIRKKAADS